MKRFQTYQPTALQRRHLHMGGANPQGERIDVTNLYLERGGQPWIAVMGEYHFARAKREDWYRELCKMKAGGITLVSTYLFWIYHEEIEGKCDFTGDLDIRQFVLEAQRAGLDVVLRLGPWAHGECRNGGFPDWLLQKPFPLRENNAPYLELVRGWYRRIYEQIAGLLYRDGGNIIAVQLENEFVDNAAHLAKLKQIALETGYDVPLYTVTGWNSASGAKIPVDEVVPVFGGYVEAPWENHTRPLPPSPHYFFQRMRNDSAIGTDLIAQTPAGDWQLPYERYPFATCELGGGIQVTHHRRPIMHGMDVYAMSLVKLGCGNNLIGYYMYHGGINRLGRLSTFQESKATGYPNDYAILGYDFQAPLSAYGETRAQYRLLNLLHLFVQDFDTLLAPMEAVEAAQFVARDDTTSLRYAQRTDGTHGFIFVNHYQRLTQLAPVRDVVFDTGTVTFPPIEVCGEVSFFLPYQMPLGSELLQYATAQPLCRVGETYFFTAIDGIAPQYCFSDGSIHTPAAGFDSMFPHGRIRIVTLSFAQAQFARKLSGQLYIGDRCDLYEYEGSVTAVQEGNFAYLVWRQDHFESICVKRKFVPATLTMEAVAEPFVPPYAEELNLGGARARSWQRLTVDGDSGMVELDYVGDAAQIYADGQLVADDFYYGMPWRIPAQLLYGKECYLVVSALRDDFYREF